DRTFADQERLAQSVGDFAETDGRVAEEHAIATNSWLTHPEHADVVRTGHVTDWKHEFQDGAAGHFDQAGRGRPFPRHVVAGAKKGRDRRGAGRRVTGILDSPAKIDLVVDRILLELW